MGIFVVFVYKQICEIIQKKSDRNEYYMLWLL